MLVEWWEDYFDDNPNKIFETLSKDGEFTFSETGDPLIDKWEREIAKGLIPDLNEGLPSAYKTKIKSLKNKDFSFDEINDEYELMGRGQSESFDYKDLLGQE